MAKESVKKELPSDRMKQAKENLESLSKRIAPFVKTSRPKVYTTEGQWHATADRMVKETS